MKFVVPPSSFATGMDVEEQSFTWNIDHFPLIRKHKSLINSQKIDFVAGETTDHPLQFQVHLLEIIKREKRWIGIFIKLNSPNPTDATSITSYSSIRYTIEGEEKEWDTDITKVGEAPDWGFQEFIDADDAQFCPDETLVIELTFRLYSPSPPKSTSSLEALQEKFQVTFLDNLRKDLSGLRKNPIPCTDIKIISNDKKEFTVQRGILAVRSDVFAVMLGSDMNEANSGVIQLPDISSTALEVLLNFIYTGDLLPEWSETEVIVELTNAAAKYQLPDLLEFLDGAMGKVCQLQNVGSLSLLARRLSLKVAEEELMLFVRKEGFSSMDDFIQMWNAELPVRAGSDDDVSDQVKEQSGHEVAVS